MKVLIEVGFELITGIIDMAVAPEKIEQLLLPTESCDLGLELPCQPSVGFSSDVHDDRRFLGQGFLRLP